MERGPPSIMPGKNDATGVSMTDLPEEALFEGLRVDILFETPGPAFGDLFTICGREHPQFPVRESGRFARAASLGFTQVDDFFGVKPLTEDGDDVSLWLYPLVDGEVVWHHDGPFTGVRIQYNVLRNPERRAGRFLKAVEILSATEGVSDVAYVTRRQNLGVPPDLARLQADVASVVAHWLSEGVGVGTDDALMIDY